MESDMHKKVEKLLGNSCSGYVLVTCSHVGEDGDMQIEVSHKEAEPLLANYLIDSAQRYLEELEYTAEAEVL